MFSSARHRHTVLVALFLSCPIIGTGFSTLAAQSWTSWNSGDAGAFYGTLLGTSVTFIGGNIGGQYADRTPINYGVIDGPYSVGYGSYFVWEPAAYSQNGLTVPEYGLIQFASATTGVVSFGAPVVNPYFAISSLGNLSNPTTYTFDSPFEVLSSNLAPACAILGCGFYSTSGNTLTGTEFSGTIRFTGVYESISFSVSEEYWHGLTVGADSVVPEPATMTLLATGLAVLGGVRRRRGGQRVPR